jgi:hypothetical protein
MRRSFPAGVDPPALPGLVIREGTPRSHLQTRSTTSSHTSAVIVEIKSTDWDTLAGHRVRPNLRSHVRQLQRYLDTFVEDLRQDGRAATGRWDSVSGVLLYPRRPADPARLQLVEEVATREALMVVWYDETPWKAERLTRDVR